MVDVYQSVDIKPVLRHWDLHCPHCRTVLGKAMPKAWEIDRPRSWLHDEMPVPLEASQPVTGPMLSHWCSTSLGTCPTCTGVFAIVELAILPAPVSPGTEGFDTLLGARPGTGPVNWIATFTGSRSADRLGLLTRCRTPFGIRDHYLFGPLPAPPPDLVEGPSGPTQFNPGSALIAIAQDLAQAVLPASRSENASLGRSLRRPRRATGPIQAGVPLPEMSDA